MLVSAAGLVLLSPLFAVVALLILLDSKGPVFFRQVRMGKGFVPFRIYKFRTMTDEAEASGVRITVAGDRRITRTGRFLRRYKFDELPQLLNILKGDMSFVGPRPEVPEYVELFRGEYARLLSVRPGITDPASLAFSREEEILASSGSWEEDYRNTILPSKIGLSQKYIETQSMVSDLRLITRTLFSLTRNGKP